MTVVPECEAWQGATTTSEEAEKRTEVMIRESFRDAVDRILAMRKVETSYCLQSFLHQHTSSNGQSFYNKLTPISDTWRSKVCSWAFNVVDHFEISRECVTVSMGIFDRYLATRGNLCSGNLVLLTSLTTLHLSIKLHETKRIKSSVLANLSRGQFRTSHIQEMELTILGALGWKLHAPTPLAFIHEFLAFLPDEVSASEKKEIYELSKYLTELAVCESSFINRQNSVLAVAAIQNVMEELMKFSRLSLEARDTFLGSILELMGHTYESQTMVATRERLRTMFSQVSATTDCFDVPSSYGTSGIHHHHHYNPNSSHHRRPTLRGGRLVSPSGSPSSTTSSCYSSGTGSKHNFWYTPSPSPPHRGRTFGKHAHLAE